MNQLKITPREWSKIHSQYQGKGLKVLKEMDKQMLIKKHPTSRYPYGRDYRDKTANDLTKSIIKYLTYRGYQAERISSSGRVIKRQGKSIYIPGTSRNGTADISATIAGRSVKIEVKIGRDRQSPEQVSYQQEVEAAGGIYYIAKEFQPFYQWVNELIDTLTLSHAYAH